jgi:uncharacterized LabA/DUF88 family protein
MTFVDGSNLFGTFRHLGIKIDDYDKLYQFIFAQAYDQLQRTALPKDNPENARLLRVYWYVVGAIDQWKLDDPKAQKHLSERFDRDLDVRPLWLNSVATSLSEAGKPVTDPKALTTEAWQACLTDFRAWYEKKQRNLESMNRFFHAVEVNTEFIEICRVGRWKVDFLHKAVEEKGVDTSLAVDMVGLADTYDTALLITGDADGLPSLAHVKRKGKQVGVVEFHRGPRPEVKGRVVSTALKLAADFVVDIYEAELVDRKIATRGAMPSDHDHMPMG